MLLLRFFQNIPNAYHFMPLCCMIALLLAVRTNDYIVTTMHDDSCATIIDMSHPCTSCLDHVKYFVILIESRMIVTGPICYIYHGLSHHWLVCDFCIFQYKSAKELDILDYFLRPSSSRPILVKNLKFWLCLLLWKCTTGFYVTWSCNLFACNVFTCLSHTDLFARSAC